MFLLPPSKYRPDLHSHFPGFLARKISNIRKHAPFYILLSDGCLSIVSFGLFRRLGTLLILPLPTTDLAAEIGLMAFVFQFLFLPNGLLLLGVLCVQNGIPDTWQSA